MTNPAVLPIAYVLLRILIIFNWLYGAASWGCSLSPFVNEPWFMRAIDVPPEQTRQPIMIGLRVIALLGSWPCL
jgi:hypothetical protein